jgi:hypothetical protein
VQEQNLRQDSTVVASARGREVALVWRRDDVCPLNG